MAMRVKWLLANAAKMRLDIYFLFPDASNLPRPSSVSAALNNPPNHSIPTATRLPGPALPNKPTSLELDPPWPLRAGIHAGMQLNLFVGQAGGRSCYDREHLPLQAVERVFVQAVSSCHARAAVLLGRCHLAKQWQVRFWPIVAHGFLRFVSRCQLLEKSLSRQHVPLGHIAKRECDLLAALFVLDQVPQPSRIRLVLEGKGFLSSILFVA
jgi:hypothetical protein